MATKRKSGAKAKGGYMGFKKLTAELKAKGASDPKALAAWIGRRKYGSEAFVKMSHPNPHYHPDVDMGLTLVGLYTREAAMSIAESIDHAVARRHGLSDRWEVWVPRHEGPLGRRVGPRHNPQELSMEQVGTLRHLQDLLGSREGKIIYPIAIPKNSETKPLSYSTDVAEAKADESGIDYLTFTYKKKYGAAPTEWLAAAKIFEDRGITVPQVLKYMEVEKSSGGKVKSVEVGGKAEAKGGGVLAAAKAFYQAFKATGPEADKYANPRNPADARAPKRLAGYVRELYAPLKGLELLGDTSEYFFNRGIHHGTRAVKKVHHHVKRLAKRVAGRGGNR